MSVDLVVRRTWTFAVGLIFSIIACISIDLSTYE